MPTPHDDLLRAAGAQIVEAATIFRLGGSPGVVGAVLIQGDSDLHEVITSVLFGMLMKTLAANADLTGGSVEVMLQQTALNFANHVGVDE